MVTDQCVVLWYHINDVSKLLTSYVPMSVKIISSNHSNRDNQQIRINNFKFRKE